MLFSSAWSAEIRGSLLVRGDGKDQPLAGQPIRLEISAGEKNAQWAETSTDLKGLYRFRGLDSSPNFLYVAQAEHGGITYSALPVRYSGPGTISLPPFRAYPTTASSKQIEATEKIILDIAKRDLIRVSQTLTLTNRGKEAFAPALEKAIAIEVYFPKESFDRTFSEQLAREEFRIDQENNRILLLKPLFPGQENRLSIEFSYALPYESRSIDLEFPLNISRSTFELFVLNSTVNVRTAQLQPVSSSNQKETKVVAYSGGPFPGDTTIRFQLSGQWRMEDMGRFGVLFGMGAILMAALWIGLRRTGNSKNDASHCS